MLGSPLLWLSFMPASAPLSQTTAHQVTQAKAAVFKIDKPARVTFPNRAMAGPAARPLTDNGVVSCSSTAVGAYATCLDVAADDIFCDRQTIVGGAASAKGTSIGRRPHADRRQPRRQHSSGPVQSIRRRRAHELSLSRCVAHPASFVFRAAVILLQVICASSLLLMLFS
jgi:hypothetical protein